MTAASLKWKYACLGFASLLLPALSTAALLLWRADVDTQHLSLIVENAARERVASELQEHARALAARAAAALEAAGNLSAPALQGQLTPLRRDSALWRLSVKNGAGASLFSWQRAAAIPAGAVTAASHSTWHDAQVEVQLAQTLAPSSVAARMQATHRQDERLEEALASALILGFAGLGGVLAWRAAGQLEPLRTAPATELMKRPGQELEQALEPMRAELQRSGAQSYLDGVLNSMTDAVFVTSPAGTIQVANTAARELLGSSEEQLRGASILGLLDERDPLELAQLVRQTRESQVRGRDGEAIPVCVSGSRIDGEDPHRAGYIFVARNISDRKRAEGRIRYLASHDPLTKLPNRMQLQHLLEQAITQALDRGQALALLYLDMDRFKEVNDTLGHASGDRVLEVLSERLQRSLPQGTVIGRMAGDELGVIIERLPLEADNRGTLAQLARSTLGEIGRVYLLDEHEVFLTASIGIALCPLDADNVIDLIRDADAAMYHSKQNGGNTFAFYSPTMNPAAVERLVLKGKLRQAIERDELVVRYEPRVSLRDGRILGAEALLRWRLPGHGDIPPARFIPLAEETRLIEDIGDWVLRRVCLDYRQLRAQGTDPGRISLNLSLKQLRQGSFIQHWRAILTECGLSPDAFELEITETTLMADPARTIRVLKELRSMGLHLSIDDFGTGYSSLSAVQQFPIDTLKIDQSFIREAAKHEGNSALVRTIILMGHSLGIDVIAEGVESVEQLDFLRQHRCDGAQGRLFGEPLPGAELLALLTRQAAGAPPFGSLLQAPEAANAH